MVDVRKPILLVSGVLLVLVFGIHRIHQWFIHGSASVPLSPYVWTLSSLDL